MNEIILSILVGASFMGVCGILGLSCSLLFTKTIIKNATYNGITDRFDYFIFTLVFSLLWMLFIIATYLIGNIILMW